MDLSKDQLLNMIMIPAIILYVVFLVVIAGTIIYSYNDAIQNDDNTSSAIKEVMNRHYTLFITVYDFSIMFLYFGMALGMFIGAYFRNKTVLLFVGGFLVWILSWFTLPFLANTGLAFMNAFSPMDIVGSRLYFTNLLFNNYVLFNVAVGAITVGLLFAKKSRDQIGSVGGSDDVFK